MVGFTYNAEEAIKLNKVKNLYEDVLNLIEKLSIIQAQNNQNNSNKENSKISIAVNFFKMKNLMLDLIISDDLFSNKH